MSPGSAAVSLSLEAANDRESCRAQLEANRVAARALWAGRSHEILRRKPAPGAWSAVECLLHLNRAGTVYLPPIDRAIEDGRRRAILGEGSYRHPWFSRWFVASLDAEVRRRFKAPRLFAPAEPDAADPTAVLREFEDLGPAIARRLEASRGLDLGRVRVISPVSPLVRLSLGMGFALFAAHERRHLAQARRALESA